MTPIAATAAPSIGRASILAKTTNKRDKTNQAKSAAEELFVNPPATETSSSLPGPQPEPAPQPLPPPPAAVTATMTAALTGTANNGDGKADPGDTINYTVQLGNTSGSDATGLSFNPALDSHTTFVPGSIKSTPICFDQPSVSTNEDTAKAITLTGQDPDGDSITFSIVSGPSHGALSPGVAGAAQTYTPSADYNGPDSFVFKVNDGTANSNENCTVSITVNAVNDPPTFTVPGNPPAVNEDAAAQSISSFVTNVKPGPAVLTNEDTQTVSFVITNNTNPGLFSSGPALNVVGASYPKTATLTYTPAANQNGTATITYHAHDNGGTSPGVDNSADQTFTITINAVNDPPVVTAPAAFAVQANMKRIGLTGLLASVQDNADNGVNGCVSTTFTVTAGSISGTSANGGTISNVNLSLGTFDFDPKPGFTGTDTFTYTVSDTGCPGPGVASTPATTVTINVAGPVIWFVNTTLAPAGNGSLSSPFNTLAAATAAMGLNANQRIFVFGASSTLAGTTVTLQGNNTLANQALAQAQAQWLIGQGAIAADFDTLFGISPPAGTIVRPAVNGTRPTINGTVTMKENSVVQGLNINVTTTKGLTASGLLPGTSGSTLTIRDVNVTSTTGNAVDISAASLSVNNAVIYTTSNSSTSPNVLISTTGIALNVVNTTIGASGLNFKSISANGAASGIVLTSTGASGGLTVAGDGGANNNGSGGTIQSTTGHGINLANVGGSVSLGYMNITNPSLTGIQAAPVGWVFPANPSGLGVNNFTLNRCNVSDNAGSNTSDDGVRLEDVTGTVTFTNNSITNSRHQGITIDNINSNISSLTMQTNTVSGTLGGDGVLFQIRGTSVLTTGNIGGASAGLGNTFSNNSSTGLQITAGDTGSIGNAAPNPNTLNIQNNFVSGNNAGMDLDLSQTSSMFLTVQNNTLIKQHTQVINMVQSTSATAGTLSVSVKNNKIGCATTGDPGCSGGVIDSGSQIGDGIRVANGAANVFITIDSNTIREVPNAGGIDLGAQAYTVNGNVKYKITSNTIVRPTGSALAVCGGAPAPCPNSQVFLLSDSNAAGGFDHLCTTISGNTVYDPTSWPNGAGQAAFYLARRTSASNTLQLEGTQANARAQILATNTITNPGGSPSSSDVIDENTSGTVTIVAAGTCGSFPSLLLAQGGVMAQLNSPTLLSSLLPPSFSGSACGQPSFGLFATTEANAIRRSLSQHDLDAMVSSAINRWSATGLTEQQIATLHSIKFEVADLSGSYLGEANGDRVQVDRDAEGKGWFVDTNPLSDASFTRAVSATRLYTDPLSAPAGHVDLLTAIEHELGHKLGLDDSYAEKDRDNLMYGYLTVGERRLPSQGQAASAVPGVSQGVHFLTFSGLGSKPRATTTAAKSAARTFTNHAGSTSRRTSRANRSATLAPMPFVGGTFPINGTGAGFTLPNGKTITITFSVTLNNPPNLSGVPPATPKVSAQGTLSGAFAGNPLLTDDPGYVPPPPSSPPNPTVTLVDLFDTTTTLAPPTGNLGSGQSVTFTATISPSGVPAPPGGTTPTGTVDFKDGVSVIAGCSAVPVTLVLGQKQAQCTTSFGTTGSPHSITAVYSGDGNFDPSTSSASVQTVSTSGTATAVTSSLNPSLVTQNVTFTATVTSTSGFAGPPTGTVTFKDNGNPITCTGGSQTLNGSGVATCQISTLTAGSHTPLTAVYNGDTNFTTSTGTLSAAAGQNGDPQVVNKSNTNSALVSSSNPVAPTVQVTYTATISSATAVAGPPTGTVTFKDGVTPIVCEPGSQVLTGGVATCKFTYPDAVGSPHDITAVYGGDPTFNGSTSNHVSEVVQSCSASVVVTSNADGGANTLRDAINTGVCDGGTITFDPSVTSITLTTGELAISKNMTITGPGAANLTISGNNASRVFNVSLGKTVIISGMTISHGLAAAGAGVYNAGSLTLSNDVITANSASGPTDGPGVYNQGTLVITDSTISNNIGVAGSLGGGIENAGGGLVTMTRCTVSGNTGSDEGGGIRNASGSTFNIFNSTISGNSANTIGGGIVNNAATLNITNSTISGNSAKGDGGGIYNTNAAAATTLTSVTITGNIADSDNDTVGAGGGINVVSGTVTLKNTIVAGNFKTSCVTPPANMVGWWPGDGNPNDIQGSNNGTLQGGATFAAGEVGQAFSFDGVDDLVAVPFSPSLAIGNAMTYDAWVLVNGQAANYQTLFSNLEPSTSSDGMLITVPPNSNTLQVYVSSGASFNVPNFFDIGQFTHTAVTTDAGVTKVYKNGSLAATFNTPTLVAATSRTTFGTHDGSSAPEPFGGLMDEVEIFNRALSGNEVNAIFSAGSAGKCKQAQADDISGTVDASSSFNLIGDAASSGGLAEPNANHNLVGVSGVGTRNIDTILNSTLADNGGPTKTHALVNGSAALETGNAFGLTTDQRGFPRPVDSDLAAPVPPYDDSDIGAFERQIAPAAPGAPNLDDASDSGINFTDNKTNITTNLSFTIPGVTSGATVQLFRDGSPVASGIASGSSIQLVDPGPLSFTASGTTHTYTAKQSFGTDTSVASAALGVTITIIPDAPVLDPSSDSGTLGDGITNDTSPTFNITNVVNGATVELLRDGAPIGGGVTGVAAGTSIQLTDPSASNGTFTYTARQTVSAITSDASAGTSITITIKPDAPDLIAASDSGSSNTDNYTNVTNPTFNITGVVSGATVDLLRDGNSVTPRATGTAVGTSIQLTDPSVVGDGLHTYTARQTVGITQSPESDPLTITIDTTVTPATPDLKSTSDSGSNSSDNITNANATRDFTISTTEVGSKVELLRGGVPVATLLSSPGGSITLTDSTLLADNTYLYSTRETDKAGNVATSGTLSVVIDATKPTVAMSSGVGNPTATTPIPATVTFSEAVTGFTIASIVPGNGTVGNFAGGPTIYTFDLTPTSPGAVSADIAAGVASDTAGNTNTAATQFNRTFDPTALSVTITPVAPDPRNTSVSSIQIVFNKAVTGFDLADLTLKLNGGANLLTGAQTLTSGDNKTWTLGNLGGLTGTSGTYVLTLTASGSGIIDAASNPLTGDATETWVVDTTPLNVTINQKTTPPAQADPVTGPSASTVINFTAVFSKPIVAGSFTNSDVAITGSAGATVANVSEVAPFDGTTFNVAVEGMTQSGTVIVDIPANRATDAAGNLNTVSTSTDKTVTYFIDNFTTFEVNSVADTDDGRCDALGTGLGNQDCTLREAINAANADAGAETITFNSTVFASPGPYVISLLTALPDITTDMTIQGPGAKVLTVERNSGAATNFRIFTITNGPPALVVAISGMTITKGVIGNAGQGGGIRVDTGATLTINDCAITSNQVSTSGFGGGIYSAATLTTINRSTFNGNQVGVGGGGGGIYNPGNMAINDSTISGNTGGNNSQGAGIFTLNVNLTISNSTIASNTAGTTSSGGGIYRGSGTVTLKSTIVGNNSATTGPDISGTVQSEGYNLIQNTSGATINETLNPGTNITGQDPQLFALADNGGPTKTHALQCTSPAIDKGNAFGLTTDQRGGTRPFDLADSVYPNAVGGDGSDIGAVEIQTGGGCQPVAVPPAPAPSTNEDTQVTITLKGTYSQNFPLTFTITQQPAHGSALVPSAPVCNFNLSETCTSTVSYTPSANYNGPDFFKFKVSAGGLDSDEADVNITVNPVNDPPVALSQPVFTDEDIAVPISLTATDVETPFANLTFTVTVSPLHGMLSGGGSNLTYTPNANYNGPDSFKFTVTDTGDGASPPLTSAAGTVSITVNPVNDAPTANAQSVATNEDTPLPITLTGSDIETAPGSLTFAITVTPSHGVLSGSGANRTYTPDANYNGPDSFKFTVTDTGDGASPALTSAEATVSITVNAVNDVPSFTKGPDQTVNGAVPQTVPNWATNISAGPPDESGQILTFLVSNNNNAIFSVQPAISPTGTLTFTPAYGFDGSATVTVRLKDDGGTLNGGVDTSAPQTFTITVHALNNPPTLNALANVVINEDAPLQTISLSGITSGPSYESSQSLTITAISGNPALIPNPSVVYTSPNTTGSISFAPLPDANGSTLITVTVKDNGGTLNGGVDTFVRTFTVTVNAVNDAPVNHVPGPQTIPLNTSWIFSAGTSNAIFISDVDAGSDPVQVTLTATDGTLTLNGTAGLSFISGDGTDDQLMSFTGSIASINAALEGMHNLAFGSGVITITTNDLGHNGAGGPLSATSTISVTVNDNLLPTLLTYVGSDRAIALDSVILLRDPFSELNDHNFSSDHRTRIALFALHAQLKPGENASAITAEAQDAGMNIFPLTVESVRTVPGFDWLTQVVVKLPDFMQGGGGTQDVKVSIRLRGQTSNQAVITILPAGP